MTHRGPPWVCHHPLLPDRTTPRLSSAGLGSALLGEDPVQIGALWDKLASVTAYQGPSGISRQHRSGGRQAAKTARMIPVIEAQAESGCRSTTTQPRRTDFSAAEPESRPNQCPEVRQRSTSPQRIGLGLSLNQWWSRPAVGPARRMRLGAARIQRHEPRHRPDGAGVRRLAVLALVRLDQLLDARADRAAARGELIA
jgi:hypothetical protein